MTETTIVSSRYSPAVVAHHCLPLGELVEDADVITITDGEACGLDCQIRFTPQSQ